MVMLLAVPAVRVGFAVRSSNGVLRWLVLDLAAIGSEAHPLRFDAETSQQRDDDCDTRRYARQPMLNLVVEVRSDACLQRRIDRGEQIAELVDDAGERAARLRGRKLIEMGRNDAPRALDHELHQKSVNRHRTRTPLAIGATTLIKNQ